MGLSTQYGKSLEKVSSELFLISGAVGIVYASLYGMEAFVGTYPAVRDFLGPISYIVAFVGLLGLHARLADRRPKLAHAGAFFAVLAGVGFLLSLLGSAGVVPSELPAMVEAIQFLFILVGWVLSFLLFSVGGLRSDAFTRTVGILLLAPVAVQVLNIGAVAAGYSSPEARLFNSGLWALSYLAIGLALRTQGVRPQRGGATPDTAS